MGLSRRVLIVKLGYAETLVDGEHETVSLGDVFRTTPILPALEERWGPCHVTWVTAREAGILLEGNPLIHRLLLWDEGTPSLLAGEPFHILVNFENSPAACRAVEHVKADHRYGFCLGPRGEVSASHQNANGSALVEYAHHKCRPDYPRRVWQELLLETLGLEWGGQPYVAVKTSNGQPITHDVGLNYRAGPKWPTKVMPQQSWEELHGRLQDAGVRVSWQQGAGDLHEYIEWINSCRVLVTQDSLGLHLALAMGRPTVGLFGPTDPQEIYGYGRLEVLHAPVQCPSMPCYSHVCSSGLWCMAESPVHHIVSAVKRVL